MVMAERASLSRKTIDQLAEAGIPVEALERAIIEADTKKASLITRLFQSNATVIGRTIYFRSGTYDPTHERGLALLAHEIAHVIQWQEEGLLFLVKYAAEYMRGLVIHLLKRVQGVQLEKHWAHDQVSYEKKATTMEKHLLRKLFEKSNLRSGKQSPGV